MPDKDLHNAIKALLTAGHAQEDICTALKISAAQFTAALTAPSPDADLGGSPPCDLAVAQSLNPRYFGLDSDED